AVQMGVLALGGEVLFQLLELQGDIRNRGVQLPGEEVALAERPEDLGEWLPALRDELEHEERGNRAGVGLVEVAEVVVPGDLAGEERALLAHPLLDERVADPVDERDAAEP